jgi:predicted nucleic acid-binding protein
MFYLDASAAVAAITEEVHSESIWAWLAQHSDAAILISGWVTTEMSSALSIKVRTNTLKPAERNEAMANWRRFCAQSLGEVAVTSDHFETAASFCTRSELGLRAGDALHLAIAESAGLRLLTFDVRLSETAPQLGIPVEPIKSLPM